MSLLGGWARGRLTDAAITSSDTAGPGKGQARTRDGFAVGYGGALNDYSNAVQSRGGVLAVCANASCPSGWLHLWRSRRAPIFECGWTCSADCTETRIEAAVRRELGGAGPGASLQSRSGVSEHSGGQRRAVFGAVGERRPHRVPLGLVMLEQGWISQTQLRKALEAQREAERGRLGRWLVHQRSVSEELVSRALALQWSCAMLPTSHHDPDCLTAALPRLLVEAFGALPLRLAGGANLYLGFAGQLDPIVALAMQRMLGLQIETGVVPDGWFQGARERMLKAPYPRVELIESRSHSGLARALTRSVESAKPVGARLVRVHDCLWLRMWLRPQEGPLPEVSAVRDVICSVAGN